MEAAKMSLTLNSTTDSKSQHLEAPEFDTVVHILKFYFDFTFSSNLT